MEKNIKINKNATNIEGIQVIIKNNEIVYK